ncbi:hypothetical protein HDU78_011690 [Chytriomyces hyalinus]|nr:hypothetical protein HDU78_011690 [Chytriomyces hyalinus]
MAANDAAVSSLGESEVIRRESFAELEQAKLKVQGLEMELEMTQTKRGAALDNVASLWMLKRRLPRTTKIALKETQAKADKAYAVIRKFKAESEAKSKEIEHQKVKMEEFVSQWESAKPVDKESADLEVSDGRLSAAEAGIAAVSSSHARAVEFLDQQLSAIKKTFADAECLSI